MVTSWRRTSAIRRSRTVRAAVSTAVRAAASHDSVADADHLGDAIDAVGHADPLLGRLGLLRESYHPSVVASHATAGADVRRVDVVGGVGLVVFDVEPARLEQLAGAAGEADLHDRVARPCAMKTRFRPAARSGSQPSTVGTKPEKARMPAGAGRSAPSPSE